MRPLRSAGNALNNISHYSQSVGNCVCQFKLRPKIVTMCTTSQTAPEQRRLIAMPQKPRHIPRSAWVVRMTATRRT